MNAARTYKLSAISVIYALSASLLLLLWQQPERATELGIEDGPLENATAQLFLVAAAIMAGHVIQMCRSKKQFKSGPAILALVAAAMFIIFAGEEISWGQRIFDLDTNEFMQEYNWQGEINFHNLHTDLFNIGFHYGALVFLVVLPLLRDQFVELFKKLRLDALRLFIAPLWLALPSLVILAMIDPRFIFTIEKPWAAAFYLLALGMGLGLLAYKLIQSMRNKAPYHCLALITSLVLIILSLYVSHLQAVDDMPNTISEYKELVIAACLAVFALWWRADD